MDALSERVARAGEPFRLFFDPEKLAADLKQLGYREIEDVPSAEMNRRYFANREDGLRVRGNVGRLLIARV